MIINGIVILYNPKIENINNILTYLPFLSRPYLIDNSSENNEKCLKNLILISWNIFS